MKPEDMQKVCSTQTSGYIQTVPTSPSGGITVMVQPGYQAPPPPREPDMVTITLRREDAEALVAAAYGVSGPHDCGLLSTKLSPGNSRVAGLLHITVYSKTFFGQVLYPRSVDDARDRLRNIGSAIGRALNLGNY